MNSNIMNKYNDLVEDIMIGYNKIKVVDNFDYCNSNAYTIFYLNKNNSFEDFKDLWNKNRETCKEFDSYSYDDILDSFNEEAIVKFDYVELGTLDIYTDSIYELEI